MSPWILAIRPRTLPAAIGPLLVGNCLALDLPQFSIFIAIVSTLCAVLLQITVNLANDYFDFKHGIDTAERIGPTRVTQSGLLSEKAVRNAMLTSLMLAIIVGVILVNHGGLPIAILAIVTIIGAMSYSGGPYPMASHGLGEISAFVFFGLVAVIGSYYLQANTMIINAWILGAAIGFFNAAIMLVNNTRDIHTDIKANKKTLAVKIGENAAKSLYQVLIYLPYVLIISGFLMGAIQGLPVLLASLSIIVAKKLSHDFAQSSGIELNPLLGRTAKLTMIFSLLFSLGLIINM